MRNVILQNIKHSVTNFIYVRNHEGLSIRNCSHVPNVDDPTGDTLTSFDISPFESEATVIENCVIPSAATVTVLPATYDSINDTAGHIGFRRYGTPNGGVTVTNTIELTSVNIKALAGTPITLIAAQGADTVIEFISAVMVHNAGTAYVEPSAPDDMVIQYGTGTDLTAAIDATGFLTVTDDEMRRVTTNLAITADLIPEKDSLVQLLNTGSNYTTGTGTMTIFATYRVHTLGL
jgi:hypothetical protein